jgi:hypothetical protein
MVNERYGDFATAGALPSGPELHTLGLKITRKARCSTSLGEILAFYRHSFVTLHALFPKIPNVTALSSEVLEAKQGGKWRQVTLRKGSRFLRTDVSFVRNIALLGIAARFSKELWRL